jgi:hypothetical protein
MDILSVLSRFVKKRRASMNEHGVAQAVETVVVVDSELIGAHYIVQTREGGHQSEKGCSRQMKIRYHRVDNSELGTLVDKKRSRA